MGKAKTWTPEEHAALAQAWINASEDKDRSDVKGTNQDGVEFFAKVVENLKVLAPSDVCSGSYHNRGAPALMNHWRDKISREVKKFNKAILKVVASKPTGCGEQEKINMACAR